MGCTACGLTTCYGCAFDTPKAERFRYGNLVQLGTFSGEYRLGVVVSDGEDHGGYCLVNILHRSGNVTPLVIFHRDTLTKVADHFSYHTGESGKPCARAAYYRDCPREHHYV